MKAIIIDKVIEIVNTNIEDIKITENQLNENLSALGMDSMAFIRIVVALEEEFECEIPDSKLLISEMDTIKKIINVLQDLYIES